MKKLNSEYIFDLKNKKLPNRIYHKFYNTSHGEDNSEGSYLLYLPPSYSEKSEREYTVIFI